jgi:hypothetical protein
MVGQEDGPVRELETLIDMTRRCMDQLQDGLEAYGAVLDRLRNGSNVQDALAAGNVVEMRRAITAALEELETARRASRVSLMRASLAEGSSVNSIAESWGISRQLVSRYIHDVEQ